MIDVKDLTFTYAGADGPTLKRIGFSVNRGEIFGFLGPSGAGKSTTQKVLIGLLRSYEGQCMIDGIEIRDWSRELYSRIGVAFEFPNLYERFTAEENLAYFASFYDTPTAPPRELLRTVGLESEAKKKVEAYSKGMRMRLNFCRALVHDPELLFLDEPTAGLDPANARLIKNRIASLRDRGRTVFLTTHNMTVAEDLCDRVAFLVDGEIRLVDNPRDLRVKHGQAIVRTERRVNGSVNTSEFPLRGLAENRTFLKAIADPNLERVFTVEPTLEDIFISTTGRNLV